MAEASDHASVTSIEGDPTIPVGVMGSFAYREFRLVMASFVIGFVFFQVRQVTNLWLVYDKTNSPLSLGLLGVFQFAPMLLLTFVGGSIADMVDRRLLLIMTQVANFTLAAVLALLMFTDQIEVWHIYAVTLVTSGVNTFEGPARMSMLPRLVPRTHMFNAITLNQIARHAAMLLGPALAGGLIAWQGPGITYAIVGAVFLPVVGVLLLVKPMPPDPGARRRGGRQGRC